ncbi:hypothetical protein V8E36_005754 [Tilletia maclaganii]
MASTSRLTMAGSGGLGASVNTGGGGAVSNLSIAEQLMQLDQAITLTMQDIDANLSAAHQTVTGKILPAVKHYGIASARTWQGAKFWMKFFEAAADVSLSGTSGLRAEEEDDDQATYDDETESELVHDGDEEVTQSQYAEETYDDEDEDDTIGIIQDAPRERNDGIADLRSTPLNARAKHFGARAGLVGRRISASPRKGSEHPGADGGGRSRLPPATEVDESREEDEEGDSLPPLVGMSPPQTLQFSVPRSRYLNTPAKEAARLMVDDVLRTIDGIADPLAMAARTRQERAAEAALHGSGQAPTSSRPNPSVVGTPLRKDKGKSKSVLKNRGRDSLPTPPTVTKLPPRPISSYIASQLAASTARGQASTTPLAAPNTVRNTDSAGSAGLVPGSIGTRSNAGRVMDEGEDEGAAGFDFSDLQLRKASPGAALTGSGASERVNTLLNLDDEDSDSQSDTDSDDEALQGANVIPAYPATASKSSWTVGSGQASSGGSRSTGSRQTRPIEDDTLFGVRAPAASSNARSGPMQNPFAKPAASGAQGSALNATTGAPSYKPVDSTVHGGRSLIAADRSDTYSAPSPTPFGSHK